MILLAVACFVTAAFYASVGFGGGSTYNALLVLSGTDYHTLPIIALTCNLIVVCGGSYKYFREGHLDIRRVLPWVVTSIPAALAGGYIPISEKVFVGILGLSLSATGLRLLFQNKNQNERPRLTGCAAGIFLAPVIGGALGLLSGMAGIGGGIFLAPVLHFLRWGNARQIAAACSFFILLNSVSGLAGQLMKLGDLRLVEMMAPYWMLFLAVFAGGQIGSYMGAMHLNVTTLRIMTALLVLYVAGQLLFRWYGMA